MNKVKIHPSLYVIVPFYICLGLGLEFFIVLMIVIFHELGHIAVSRLMGLKLKYILITPIGIKAEINNINLLSITKRLMIYIAGPALNLITCILFRVIGYENYILRYLSDVNFYIFLFNMLPVLPLDAGNIFFNVFSYFKGVINSAKIMKRLGKLVGFLIILIGITQLVLSGYNMSALLIGIFIIKNNDNEYFLRVKEFYSYLSTFSNEYTGRYLMVKKYFIEKNTVFSEIVKYFNYDFFYEVVFSNSKNVLNQIDIAKGIFQMKSHIT